MDMGIYLPQPWGWVCCAGVTAFFAVWGGYLLARRRRQGQKRRP